MSTRTSEYCFAFPRTFVFFSLHTNSEIVETMTAAASGLKRKDLGILASYASANIALSFINKALVRQGKVNIGLLLLAQCFATVVLVYFVFGSAGKRELSLKRALLVFPASALYAIQHQSRMQLFLLTSVDVVLVARQLVPVITCALERIARTETKRPQSAKTVGCMVAIIVGVSIYAYGKGEYRHSEMRSLLEIESLRAVLVHLFSTAVANVYSKYVCQQMPPSDYTLLVNLTSIPIFLYSATNVSMPAKGMEAARALSNLKLSTKVLCFASVVISIAISLAASFTTQILAAASFAVFSNVSEEVPLPPAKKKLRFTLTNRTNGEID